MGHPLILLVTTGALAGFIDSVAGGGGLITLPVLSIVLLPGAHAIGTNKIVGSVGALTAWIVYARKRPLPWKAALGFVLSISLGSALGSHLTPFLPPKLFRILLLIVCPLILVVVWRKDSWILSDDHSGPVRPKGRVLWATLLAGLACGFYDGAFGPGGGTFMLLALLFVVKLPLIAALGVSKFANTVSAGVALVSYGVGGYVHVKEGLTMALGMFVGAFAGSHWASRSAVRVVRPMLVVAVCLLLARLLLSNR